MVVWIAGERRYLWRAVDHEGEVLEVLVQRTRDKAAALGLPRKLLKKQGVSPAVIVTDKRPSYAAAFRDLGLTCRHVQGVRRNNRAGNVHRPIRRRERKRQPFKSVGSAQRFLSVHATVCIAFDVQCHLISRRTRRAFSAEALRQWQAATAAA